jgi:hypothetical protein
MICKAAAECRNSPFRILRALYRITGTTARIEAADALTREIHIEARMGPAFGDAIGALRICMNIRNQYAHCTWATGHKGRHGGLYFADLSLSAEASGGWVHHWRHVNVKLLKEQEAYFEYTKALLLHIETGTTGRRNAKQPVFPKPPALTRPRMHNPPEKHISPWLDAGEKQRHSEATQQPKRPSVYKNVHAWARNRLREKICRPGRRANRRCERRYGSAALLINPSVAFVPRHIGTDSAEARLYLPVLLNHIA